MAHEPQNVETGNRGKVLETAGETVVLRRCKMTYAELVSGCHLIENCLVLESSRHTQSTRVKRTAYIYIWVLYLRNDISPFCIVDFQKSFPHFAVFPRTCITRQILSLILHTLEMATRIPT